MATHKPVIFTNGRFKQLPAGDTLEGVGGGSSARTLAHRAVLGADNWPDDGQLALTQVRLPVAGTFVSVVAVADVAGAGGVAEADILLNGNSIMATDKLKWDAGETTTATFSGNQPALTTTAFAIGDTLSIRFLTNFTATRAKGLVIYLNFNPSI